MKPNSRIGIADNIAARRKALGLTQQQLAERIFVSNKAVSKWERGAGYPELPQIIALSDVLGISVDDLVRGDRHGIAIAGNLLIDLVKTIEGYPTPGMLANITSLSRAVGGCMANTGIDLARIDRTLSIGGYGRVGDDENGKYVTLELQKCGIDVSGVTVSRDRSTGFSDVMSDMKTGERTFFHHRGANAEFSPEDIRLSSLKCKMFHIGYILLLDRFDEKDDEYGTVMARFLHDVQSLGIKTSFDVVSSSDGMFAEKVIPALRYTDNAVMNEIEASGVSGIPVRDRLGHLNVEAVRRTAEKIKSFGVSERVIIHAREGGFSYDGRKFTFCPALALPEGYIKGTVGAGDAFTAGCLYGIYNNYTDEEMLRFAAGCSAASLSAEDSVSGMRSKEEIEKLIEKVGFEKGMI